MRLIVPEGGNIMVSKEYAMGFALAIVMAVVILFILWKYKKKTVKGNFDERQELIRGRGYKYATFTLLILLALDMMAESSGIIDVLPVAREIVTFFIIMAGVMVYALYCIKNDSFFGVGQDTRTYRALMWVIIVLNAFTGLNGLRDGVMENGKLASSPCMSLVFCTGFTIIMIALYVKKAKNAREELSEESPEDTSDEEM